MRHKHADLIIAWANGAEIQARSPFTEGEWIDVSSPFWDGTAEYRIKLKPKTIKYKRFIGNDDDGRTIIGTASLIHSKSHSYSLWPNVRTLVKWIDNDWQEIEVEDV